MMAVALDDVWVRVKNVCKQNGLLILSVLAVVVGCLLGFFLRTRRLSEQVSLSPPHNHLWRHKNQRRTTPLKPLHHHINGFEPVSFCTSIMILILEDSGHLIIFYLLS